MWLMVCGLGTLAGLVAGFGAWSRASRRFRHATIGAALAFAVGMVGGVSSLIEDYVTPDIRAWNRISLLIAFFSLFAVALLLDSLARRLRARRRGRVWIALVFGAVIVFGVYEQTSPSDAPNRGSDDREYRSDATLVAEIQARLPAGASVFQLPYLPFPEGYPDTPCCGAVPTYATKYESLRGYLHSTTLRWSYGAIKGRPADWSAQLAGQPLSYVLPAVVSAGFDGLWVDPAGFDPATAQRIRSALITLLGQAPITSPDRDLWFFDLRPYVARLRRSQPPARLRLLTERTLYPLRTDCATGGVSVVDPSPAPVTAQLAVHQADGTYRRRLTLAPGMTVVSVPGADTTRGRVLYSTLTDTRLTSYDRAAGQGSAGGVVVGLTGPGCPD
jgi:phosphoglycerol transferase